MFEKNGYNNLTIIEEHVNNRYWFLFSALFFLLATYVYLLFSPVKYKVSAEIIVADKARSPENIADQIGSKYLVQQAINQLPFQVSYYKEGILKNTELYGSDVPVKVIFNRVNAVNAPARVWLNVLDSHQFGITQNDTISSFFFTNTVSYSFAKFKVVKAHSFENKPVSLILNFNDPEGTLEEYYDHLEVKTINNDNRALKISVTASSPQKGIDFLYKLVRVYNTSDGSKKASAAGLQGNEDDLQHIKKRLAALRLRLKKLSEKDAELNDARPETDLKSSSLSEPALRDSVLKVNSNLKILKTRYTALAHNTKNTSKKITAKPVLAFIEKPGDNISAIPHTGLVYFFALLMGITLPLLLPYLKYFNITIHNPIDLKKILEWVNEIRHAKEID